MIRFQEACGEGPMSLGRKSPEVAVEARHGNAASAAPGVRVVEVRGCSGVACQPQMAHANSSQGAAAAVEPAAEASAGLAVGTLWSTVQHACCSWWVRRVG
jgi:hypothetical protein